MPHLYNHRDGGAWSPPSQPQSPPPKPNPKLLSLLLKILIMTFITSSFFLLLSLASLLLLPILIFHHNHHHHNHQQIETHHRNPNSSNGLSSKQIKKLPLYRFDDQTGDDCVVCLDGFKTGQRCRKLEACGHVFHWRCVDTWLAKVAACPVCRTPVRVHLDQEFWAFGWRRNQFRFFVN
ncbi:hypothetical protein ACFE04_008231 [Oxalis oulophora]